MAITRTQYLAQLKAISTPSRNYLQEHLESVKSSAAPKTIYVSSTPDKTIRGAATTENTQPSVAAAPALSYGAAGIGGGSSIPASTGTSRAEQLQLVKDRALRATGTQASKDYGFFGIAKLGIQQILAGKNPFTEMERAGEVYGATTGAALASREIQLAAVNREIDVSGPYMKNLIRQDKTIFKPAILETGGSKTDGSKTASDVVALIGSLKPDTPLGAGDLSSERTLRDDSSAYDVGFSAGAGAAGSAAVSELTDERSWLEKNIGLGSKTLLIGAGLFLLAYTYLSKDKR